MPGWVCFDEILKIFKIACDLRSCYTAKQPKCKKDCFLVYTVIIMSITQGNKGLFINVIVIETVWKLQQAIGCRTTVIFDIGPVTKSNLNSLYAARLGVLVCNIGCDNCHRLWLSLLTTCFMALAYGRYNTHSDWLLARSEQLLCSCNAHRPITDFAN